MVKLRDDVPEPVKQAGAKLEGFLSPFVEDEQAEAARQRFERAVFHSRYSVDEFESALEEHRHKMRDLGGAIDDLLSEFRKEWQRGTARGRHRGYANRAIAKTYFKRIIALEERIDSHLEKFEQKLHVLTAWRQYKVQNDIGSEVDTDEVQAFMADEFDQFEVGEESFEVQEGDQIAVGVRERNGGDVVSEEEQQLLDEFVEKEFDDATATDRDTGKEQEADTIFEEMSADDTAAAGRDSASTGTDTADEEVDDEITEFLKNEGVN